MLASGGRVGKIRYLASARDRLGSLPPVGETMTGTYRSRNIRINRGARTMRASTPMAKAVRE
jgi:hypothetical protein